MKIQLQLEPDALWRRRFQSSHLFYTQRAFANPSRGIVSAKIEGETFQLYAWDIVTNKLIKLTNEVTSVYFGWLAPDGQSVFFLKDDHGSEQGYLVKINYQSREQANVTSNLPPFTLRGLNICKSGKMIVFNAVDETGFNYYRMNFQSDGSLTEPHCLYSTKAETWDAHLSYDGEFLAVKSTARAEGRRTYSTLIFDMNGSQVADLWDGTDTSIEPAMFSPIANDFRLLATTTHSGTKRPFVWDVANGQRHALSTTSIPGDIEPLDWSGDGETLLFRQIYQARIQLHTYKLDRSKVKSFSHSEGNYTGKQGSYSGGLSATYFSPTGDVWGQWSNSSTPPMLIVLDENTGETKGTKLTVSDAPSGQPEKSVSFVSTDGTAVQGWLSVPNGNEPFPTIISLHGGPHEHVTAGYDPFSQVWLDHGFAHFTVNYRGSSGFGHEFQNQILGNVGYWELEDIVSARRWLIEQGISNGNEIVLSGGSYGGFLVILALIKHSDLWRAGIAKSAVVDWSMNYCDCSEAIRGLTRNLFGGTPEELPEKYESASPIHYAEQIMSPLLIFHAENDSRATQSQMTHFALKMESLGKSININWLKSGHNYGNVTMLQNQLIAELKFVQNVLVNQMDEGK